jgi:phage portal protein BeeE
LKILNIFKRKSKAEQIALENRSASVALTLSQLATGSRNLGGLSVTPLSMLGVASVFSAIRIRGESLANLPLRVIRKVGREKKPSTNNHLISLLSDSPDGQITATQFLQTLESH